MQAEDSVYRGPNGIEVAFTDQPITGWGGLAIVARFFEAVGLRRVLKEALPDGRRSPNQVPVVDVAMGLLVTILMGAVGSRTSSASGPTQCWRSCSR